MKRIDYERSTDYYDERLLLIDEQICELLQQRRELSNNNPGLPFDERISGWAEKYGFYEDYLKYLFDFMLNEEMFRPEVKPIEFRKHIPILKTLEHEEKMYSITHIKQYSNASIVTLYVDWHEEEEDTYTRIHSHRDSFFELSISDEYDCRWERGGGGSGSYRYNYIISPPLPDDPTGLQFVFKEEDSPYRGKQTGLELVFHLE
ncbi:hypothetical protein [Bacillus sp. JJ722]|uniref:hypothetical protein n=1 Tax=Bacillus sp. JJ722 TaxID=3122973 RepID=UPI002FFF7146